MGTQPHLADGHHVPAALQRRGAALAALGRPHLDSPHRAGRFDRRIPDFAASASRLRARQRRVIRFARSSRTGSARPSITTSASTASACSSFCSPRSSRRIAILCSWESIHENVKGFFISLLVIETAMIGVFVSLDLFLFFVFWELTLIPMYFMIGMWGHERRIYAAVKFILYTMFGSILMLVAILWLYNLAGTFDLPDIESEAASGPDRFSATHRTAALRRVLPGVRHQGAALPAAHLAARRAHRSAHGRLRDPGGRDAEARHLRHPALLPAAVSGRGAPHGPARSPCWRSSASSTARWSPPCSTI